MKTNMDKSRLRYRDENREWKDVEIGAHDRIELTDNDGNRYEIRPDKFGGIEILASDGKLTIEPCVSNQVILKTRS